MVAQTLLLWLILSPMPGTGTSGTMDRPGGDSQAHQLGPIKTAAYRFQVQDAAAISLSPIHF